MAAGQPARDFTCFVVAGRNIPLVDNARGPGPANAYCALSLLNPNEKAPEEGLVAEHPRGTPTSAVLATTNPVIFNSEVVMRKQVSPGSSLLITVWHRATPESGQRGDLKLGKVLVPLPVEGPQAMWYTIGDDSGVAVMGSGGGFAEVQVQIVMPGQVRPPVPTHPTQQPQLTQNTSSLVPQAPAAPVGGTQSKPKAKLDLKGYTNEQIKDALLKEKQEAEEEERMQMEDINDDLLRAAEVEEALLSGKAPVSAAPLGQSALPFSPKLGYMSPKLSYQVDPGTMQPAPAGTTQHAPPAGTTQQPMPYFGTIAQPKSAAPQGMSMPPGMSAMPSGMSAVPVSGSRVPTAIVNGVPVYSDNAADPFAGVIQGNKINAAPIPRQMPTGYSQPPMPQSAGPPGLPAGFVPSGPQQPRR